MRYWPEPSVIASFVFSISAGLDALTVTPGSTAPDASRTDPVSEACANTVAGNSETTRTARHFVKLRMTRPPDAPRPILHAARTNLHVRVAAYERAFVVSRPFYGQRMRLLRRDPEFWTPNSGILHAERRISRWTRESRALRGSGSRRWCPIAPRRARGGRRRRARGRCFRRGRPAAARSPPRSSGDDRSRSRGLRQHSAGWRWETLSRWPRR